MMRKICSLLEISAHLLIVNHDKLVRDKLKSKGGNLLPVGLRYYGTKQPTKVSPCKMGLSQHAPIPQPCALTDHHLQSRPVWL